MDGNSTLSRKFLNLLKILTKQFSLIKCQKYVFFNIAKLQIRYLICLCYNTFTNLFYCQAYINDTSNECSSNLSSEQGSDSTKFLKVDVQSNVQLTPTFVLKEIKMTYSMTITKQQRKKIQKTLFKVFFFFSIYLKYLLSSSLNFCFTNFMDN